MLATARIAAVHESFNRMRQVATPWCMSFPSCTASRSAQPFLQGSRSWVTNTQTDHYRHTTARI